MEEVTVITENSEYVYDFEETPTEEQINDAMDTIGGRPRRPL